MEGIKQLLEEDSEGYILEIQFREVFWHFVSNELVFVTQKGSVSCKGRRKMHCFVYDQCVTIFSGKEQGQVVNGMLCVWNGTDIRMGWKAQPTIWVWESTTLWILFSDSLPHVTFQFSNIVFYIIECLFWLSFHEQWKMMPCLVSMTKVTAQIWVWGTWI